MRLPGWLRPIAVLVAVYFAIMYVATFWLVAWHDWDWYVLRWLSAQQPPGYSSQVVLLDVANYDRRNPELDRQTIAAFLRAVVAHHAKPAAVILDFFFEASENGHADAATTALSSALDAASKASVPVYATISKPEMLQSALGGVDWTPLGDLDWDNVYNHLSGGTGHTILNLYDDGLFYQACYAGAPKFDSTGQVVGRFDVPAVAYLAVQSAQGTTGGCDPTIVKIVRVGSHDEFASKGLDNISSAHPVPAKFDLQSGLDGKYVLIATVEKDVGPVAGRSNPELLAWAIGDLLAGAGSAYFEPVPYGDMLLVLIATFSLVTVVAFTAAFQLLRRTRAGARREWLPWISAGAAIVIAFALFGGLEMLLLLAKHIAPQVSLVALSVVVSAVLSGERGRQVLYEEANRIDGVRDEPSDYDVFISYAHDELEWVQPHLYEALRAVTLPDGRKLELFFDKAGAIGVGTDWQRKISLAVDHSSYVVPVYSEKYFARPYCRYELGRALQKWVVEGPGTVLPVVLGTPGIPPEFNSIQWISADDDPEAVAKVIASIVAGLVRTTAPAPK